MKRKFAGMMAFAMVLSALSLPDVDRRLAAEKTVFAQEADSNLLSKVNEAEVTAEDLGIPGEKRYGTSYYAKNIWDMAVKDGKVLLSMGDYESNTGRVPIYYYTNDSTEKKECSYNGFSGGLSSEEIKRFMEIDGEIYATATDPLGAAHGSYYKYDSAKNQWTDYYTLQAAVHVYDMVEYDGKIFFGGMYRIQPGKDQIYCCVNSLDKKDFCTSKSSQVVKFYYQDGTEFESTECVSSYDGKTYYCYDYWRAYNLFVYKNELYAIHTSNPNYSCTTTSGLFKYDKEKNGFYMVYDGKESQTIVSAHRNYTHFTYANPDGTYAGGKKLPFYFSFEDNSQVYEELKYGQETVFSEPVFTAKFETDKWFVVVCNGIFKCPDMMSCEPVSLGKGYENYVVRDAFEQDGKYYFLASVKNGKDDFTTAVFETDDNFEKFRKVVSFPTKSFARSFAYNDGYLYFGLGSNGEIDGIGSSEVSTYSGTVLRINLAEYAKNEGSSETTEKTTEVPVTTEKKTEIPATTEKKTEVSTTTEKKTETPTTIESKLVRKKGDVFSVKGVKYKVLEVKNGEGKVECIGAKNKKCKNIVIPAKLSFGDEVYKVTAIRKYAFKKYKKLTSVTIGSNVTTIGKEAFRGCSKLKKVTIKSKKLKKVGKNAFKGIKSNAKIKVPSSKKRKYKKLLKLK
ncbi:MAG: leucine-rich repeat protein [Clostridiales bacterium]|nr:leucine-rich repeat protein [Clostridiales bacterium]